MVSPLRMWLDWLAVGAPGFHSQHRPSAHLAVGEALGFLGLSEPSRREEWWCLSQKPKWSQGQVM